MADKVERECPVCFCRFYAESKRLKWGRQTTCSRRCSYKLRGAKCQTKQQYECPVCGKLFFRSPAQVEAARHKRLACSRNCAYKIRQRVVERPYKLVKIYDRTAARQKAWETRRRNPKPYPETARKKAAAQTAERIANGQIPRVSKFEKEAAKVFRQLGFFTTPSVPVRRADGTYQVVFDIVAPLQRLVIECHGTFWHGGRWTWDEPHPVQARNLTYEERKLIVATELGYKLRLLWEHDFKKDPVGACLAIFR